MITVRKSADRGHASIGWLDSRHTFSFADYQDPAHVNFGALRVINEDRVIPGAGFNTHGHRDMEIVTWVLDGELAHKDSLGTGAVIRPGEAQRMTAGTGIRHSEMNPSKINPVHLLQIWLLPEREGLTPGYEQKDFTLERDPGKLTLIGARDGRDGAITIHQDVDLYVADLDVGKDARLALKPGRRAWVQVARGGLTLNGVKLAQGDGAAVTGESALAMSATGPAEALVFDLA